MMMMTTTTTTTTTSPTPFVSSCREVKKRSSKNVRSRTPFVTERQSTRWRRFYSTTTRTTASCTTKTRFDVYIEDTDHYAVVYYANYFRFCAKAFENALRMRGEFGRDDDVVECYRIEEAKYQQPAVLGDVLTVETTIVNDNGDDGITWKRWIVEHTVRKRRGEKDDADDARCSRVECDTVEPIRADVGIVRIVRVATQIESERRTFVCSRLN